VNFVRSGLNSSAHLTGMERWQWRHNPERIEPGLTLYEHADGMRGLEYDAGGRRIDILAIDRNGAFVVLEPKVSKGYDRVVGRLLRYVNWMRFNLAEPGQRVRGMIVRRTLSDDLRIACSSVPDVELFEYQLSVTVTKAPAIEPPIPTFLAPAGVHAQGSAEATAIVNCQAVSGRCIASREPSPGLKAHQVAHRHWPESWPHCPE